MDTAGLQTTQTHLGTIAPRVEGHPTSAYSVVIPAWNESLHIRQTIKALNKAKSQVQAQQRFTGDVIVVDNNSTDDTAAIATELGATVVFEPVNQIARARNTGAAASDTQFLIFLDADTNINATLLRITLDKLASGEVVGGGSTVSFDREINGFAKLLVNCWNWWSVKTRAAAGCYIFCTQEAFSAVGGFDEKQYAAEELVLSKKLRRYAKSNAKKFVILKDAPVVTSARKLEWYSKRQKVVQLVVLLIPGATRSKKLLGMWYDRSRINNEQKPK